jgi:putative hydrolase of the HAD superfamily
VYMPYHVTWAHERDTDFRPEHGRVFEIAHPAELPAAVARIEAAAAPRAAARGAS